MGMTHYWKRKPELPAQQFSEAIGNFRKIIKTLQISLAGADGFDEPVLTDEEIIFNGAEGTGCEPFAIRSIQYPRPGRKDIFAHCKTEHMPYGMAVQCCLIILKHHLREDIKISSDSKEEYWDSARSICMDKLGYGSDFRIDNG